MEESVLRRKNKDYQPQSESIINNITLQSEEPRLISLEEAQTIFYKAKVLEQLAERKCDDEIVAAAIREHNSVQEGGVSLSAVYEAAKSLNIPKQYLDRAISLVHPSEKEIFEDIKKYGARPSEEVLLERYHEFRKTFNNELLEALKNMMPNERFAERWWSSSRHNDIDIQESSYTNNLIKYKSRTAPSTIKKVIRRGLFKKEIIDKEEEQRLVCEDERNVECLANILHFYRGGPPHKVIIFCMSPLFLRACGETIKNLEKHLENIIEPVDLRHDYDYKLDQNSQQS